MVSENPTTPTLEPDFHDVLEEGMIVDYISQQAVKDSPKEQVRQRIARALFHEYGLSVDDMEPDFSIKVNGKRKRADIAIFGHDQDKTLENIHRLVICRPEPASGKKAVTKIRDHAQAARDLEELQQMMSETPHCRFGLWTNGLEFFFVERESTRFEDRFKPIGDWPLADESMGTQQVSALTRARKADPDMLRTAFRRCHNFIHGNEGMPKDVAFWQFLYLIFSKMHDEQLKGVDRRFWAGANEQFTPEGRREIRQRVIPLFNEVKAKYKDIFRGNEEITLSDRALAFMVSELARYDLTRTDVDAKGAAYQEIVGTNLRGDRGQYFTPRGAIRLMVQMLDPKPGESVLDPSCGTGGFLVATLQHMANIFKQDEANQDPDSTEVIRSVQQRLAEYASEHLFGADFDQFLVRAAQMNVVMASSANAHLNLYHIDSLEFPNGHLDGLTAAIKSIPLGSVDVVMSNPPFGADIPVTDPNILRSYELAHTWEKQEDGNFRQTNRLASSVSPEILFVERCLKWLKPGGRMGIVLPDGILGNPGDEYIRWWIMRHAFVLASVDLPVEVFIVEANVNILTSLLFLKKKTEHQITAEDLGHEQEYPVFMAVAEKVGFDRRGNTLYERHPNGEEKIVVEPKHESIRINGKVVERKNPTRRKIIDDDLPKIAQKYIEFRQRFPEPGA